MGWNFAGYLPGAQVTDIRRYAALVFWIKVDAEALELAPYPAFVFVGLASSVANKQTRMVPVASCSPGFLDGDWHEVVVPLTELYSAEEDTFDPGRVWEIWLGTSSPTPRRFDVYLDDIAVERPLSPEATCGGAQSGRTDYEKLPNLPRYPCGAPKSEGDGATSEGTASGYLAPSTIQSTIHARYPQMYECYQKALQTNPELGGRISARMLVGDDGRVKSIEPICTSLDDPAVVDCVIDVFRQLEFPRPEGGPVQLEYPVMFVPR
jgi:hypothetical protein